MPSKPKGSAAATLTRAEIARELSRSRSITPQEEHILRMRSGANVPRTHVLERADGGNPTAKEAVDRIQAALFRQLFQEDLGDGSTKSKIVRALKKKS